MKILLGSIMHESNTFAPTVTDVEVFKKTQYLFYVARGDGSHVFTRTYEEHLAAIRSIRGGDPR